MTPFARKPNIDEVARRARVTRSTVSKAFSGNDRYPVSETTRARIFEIAREIGYQPSVAARRMNARRARVIALLEQESWSLLNSIDNPSSLAADRFSGAHDITHAVGYDLLPITIKVNQEGKDRLLSLYLGQHFDGIICIAPHFGLDYILPLAEQGCVIITDGEKSSHPNIYHQESWIMGIPFHQHMVPHLAATGRKYLAGVFPTGFRAPKGVRLIPLGDYGLSGDGPTLDAHGSKLLADHPKLDAILVQDDLHAWKIYKSLKRLGVRVPEQITVAGLSDFRNPLRPLPEHLLVQAPITFAARAMTRQLIATLEPERLALLDLQTFSSPRPPAILTNSPRQFRVLADYAERLERLSQDQPRAAD